MKELAGPRLRRLVRAVTRHPVQAAMVGVGSGALVQSTNAVTFIVVGLVSAGAITVQAGMPIVTWAYAGTTLRLLLISLDSSALTYALLSLVGAAYLFETHKSPRHGFLVNAAMGLGLLMLGVQLTVMGARPLGDSAAVREAMAFASQFYFWGFIVGTVLATVMQGMTVSVIAIALVSGGLLGLDQTMLIVVGANLGSGLMSWIQASTLKGTERQLSVYQVILKVIGCLVLLPLLSLEHFAGVPTIVALTGAITTDVALQVTLVHWLFQLVAALVASPLNGPIYRLVARLSPPSAEEVLERPAHLYNPRPTGAAEAIRQVELEQDRLMQRLPLFLHGVRPGEAGPKPPSLAVLQRSGRALHATIRDFTLDAAAQAGPGAESDRLLRLADANQVLAELQANVAHFVAAAATCAEGGATDGVTRSLVEGLHALLEIVAAELGDAESDPEFLVKLVADRSVALLAVRERVSGGAAPSSPEERLALWRSIDLFEQIVLLLRQYVWSRSTTPA
nr:Na/Pi symporter [Roseococcus thiosulfatophilus]